MRNNITNYNAKKPPTLTLGLLLKLEMGTYQKERLSVTSHSIGHTRLRASYSHFTHVHFNMFGNTNCRNMKLYTLGGQCELMMIRLGSYNLGS